MSAQDSESELLRLERLAALLRESPGDTEAMSEEKLTQHLKDNKVDMTSSEKRFQMLLKKARARRRLEVAHSQRLRAIENAKKQLSSGSIAMEAVRVKVRGLIERFGKSDPDQAQVYAREFEKATPEDLLVLEEDLTLLEMDPPDDEQGDKQD